MGEPAYDGGTLPESRAPSFLGADDPRKAVHRTPDIFAEAAEIDREYTRRWVQLHAVQGAFRGR